jgi:hypothetical protein
MNSLFITLFPAAAAALSLVGLVAVTLRMQKLAGTPVSQPSERPDPVPGIMMDLKSELTALSERISALESATHQGQPVLAIRSGMNLNKRTQALRQHRQGQAADQIAKSLDMPKAELDLLLKVQRLVSSSPV